MTGDQSSRILRKAQDKLREGSFRAAFRQKSGQAPEVFKLYGDQLYELPVVPIAGIS